MPLNNAWNSGFRSFLDWWHYYKTSPKGEAGGDQGATKPPELFNGNNVLGKKGLNFPDCNRGLRGLNKSSIKIERAHENILDLNVRTDTKHIDAKVQLELFRWPIGEE